MKVLAIILLSLAVAYSNFVLDSPTVAQGNRGLPANNTESCITVNGGVRSPNAQKVVQGGLISAVFAPNILVSPFGGVVTVNLTVITVAFWNVTAPGALTPNNFTQPAALPSGPIPLGNYTLVFGYTEFAAPPGASTTFIQCVDFYVVAPPTSAATSNAATSATSTPVYSTYGPGSSASSVVLSLFVMAVAALLL
jgi:hypothetical protein